MKNEAKIHVNRSASVQKSTKVDLSKTNRMAIVFENGFFVITRASIPGFPGREIAGKSSFRNPGPGNSRDNPHLWKLQLHLFSHSFQPRSLRMDACVCICVPWLRAPSQPHKLSPLIELPSLILFSRRTTLKLMSQEKYRCVLFEPVDTITNQSNLNVRNLRATVKFD